LIPAPNRRIAGVPVVHPISVVSRCLSLRPGNSVCRNFEPICALNRYKCNLVCADCKQTIFAGDSRPERALRDRDPLSPERARPVFPRHRRDEAVDGAASTHESLPAQTAIGHGDPATRTWPAREPDSGNPVPGRRRVCGRTRPVRADPGGRYSSAERKNQADRCQHERRAAEDPALPCPRDKGRDPRPTSARGLLLADPDHVSGRVTIALIEPVGHLVREGFTRGKELVLELIPTLLLT
jgi:hypothetical protein